MWNPPFTVKILWFLVINFIFCLLFKCFLRPLSSKIPWDQRISLISCWWWIQHKGLIGFLKTWNFKWKMKDSSQEVQKSQLKSPNPERTVFTCLNHSPVAVHVKSFEGNGLCLQSYKTLNLGHHLTIGCVDSAYFWLSGLLSQRTHLCSFWEGIQSSK